MSVIVDVAEAIKDELNDETWTPAFTAVRSYGDFDDVLENLGTLAVDVVPDKAESILISRGKLQYTCHVLILVRKRLNVGIDEKIANADIDPLVDLLQSISEFFAPSQVTGQSGRSLATLPSATWDTESKIEHYYSRGMLRGRSQFSGLVSLAYKVSRAAGA